MSNVIEFKNFKLKELAKEMIFGLKKSDFKESNYSIFLLSLLLVPLVTSSNENETYFSLSCSVLDSIGIKLKDGKSYRYSGYSDNPTVGEDFFISFNYDETNLIYYFSLETPFSSAEHLIQSPLYLGTSILSSIKQEKPLALKYRVGAVESSTIVIHEDYIEISNPFLKAVGKRYYKNDWQFQFATNYDFSSFITTTNCLGMSEEYNSILKRIRNFHKNQKLKDETN